MLGLFETVATSVLPSVDTLSESFKSSLERISDGKASLQAALTEVRHHTQYFRADRGLGPRGAQICEGEVED
jgi:hypothetical protein